MFACVCVCVCVHIYTAFTVTFLFVLVRTHIDVVSTISLAGFCAHWFVAVIVNLLTYLLFSS